MNPECARRHLDCLIHRREKEITHKELEKWILSEMDPFGTLRNERQKMSRKEGKCGFYIDKQNARLASF